MSDVTSSSCPSSAPTTSTSSDKPAIETGFTSPSYSLNETCDTVNWPSQHYVYIEEVGPFEKTASSTWTQLHTLIPTIRQHNKITKYAALYKMDQQIYRAGVFVENPPVDLPAGVKTLQHEGGKYVRFVMTGGFNHLGEACGRVYKLVAERGIVKRNDFSVEYYVSDPHVVSADKLVTELLVPTV